MKFGRPLAAFTVTDDTALGALLRERSVPLAERMFPLNLTKAERRAVVAYIEHRNQEVAARVLGIARHTLNQQITAARDKAKAKTSREMLVLFRQATERRPA